MKKFLLIAGMALAAAGFCAARAEAAPQAKAVMINAEGKETGSATLEEAPGGVRVRLQVSNMAPGPHAFHIHAVGLCEPPDFKSTGGHFNPGGKKHGKNNPEGPHAGDLPDLIVAQDGTGTLDVVVPDVTLNGEGPNSLFHPGGTSLLLHASGDDNTTDPSGNSGPRIACGVITRVS